MAHFPYFEGKCADFMLFLCNLHGKRCKRLHNKKGKKWPSGKESLEILSNFALVNLSKNVFVYNSKERVRT